MHKFNPDALKGHNVTVSTLKSYLFYSPVFLSDITSGEIKPLNQRFKQIGVLAHIKNKITTPC